MGSNHEPRDLVEGGVVVDQAAQKYAQQVNSYSVGVSDLTLTIQLNGGKMFRNIIFHLLLTFLNNFGFTFQLQTRLGGSDCRANGRRGITIRRQVLVDQRNSPTNKLSTLLTNQYRIE